jgi:murein DD-endopeptidase MepM/ murein hydrolase activator NlpD
MITILLIIIGCYAVDIFKRHRKPEYIAFYQTTLSLVICGLFYQVIVPVFSSESIAKRLAKVDYGSTATISKTDPIVRPEWNPLVAKQKEEEQVREVLREINDLAAKNGVDKVIVCGDCAENDAKFEKVDYNFIWPVKDKAILLFHEQGSEGINFSTPEGTPVVAIQDGEVAYADEKLAGYGKLIIIRHRNGFISAYAHNSKLLVKKGDRVSRDSIIAKSGHTGNVASPQLYFEIRYGHISVDPNKIIPNDTKHFSQNY